MNGRYLILLMIWGALSGCAVTHVISITAKPGDASVRIDGVERGNPPVVEQFVFNSPTDSHSVVVSRPGYKDSSLTLTRDDERKTINLELRPQTKVIHLNVTPVAGLISIDGKPASAEPTTTLVRELEFTLDAKNQWTTHTVTVDRPNHQSASAIIRYLGDSNYTLNLPPMSKNISIASEPPGASVFLDFQNLGAAPLKEVPVTIPVDEDTNDYKPRRLRAEKPGYDPVTLELSWDNGKTDYKIDLAAKTKAIHFTTDPAGATIKIDGSDVAPDASGGGSTTLQFPPTNDKGDLKSYTATITKKTADAEWEPQTVPITWENAARNTPCI